MHHDNDCKFILCKDIKFFNGVIYVDAGGSEALASETHDRNFTEPGFKMLLIIFYRNNGDQLAS